ncbi:MAG: NUDIX hydrolase [Chloroflexi bacterium]|nr:NUDIX hydrolase [Chloroflexota bacterium]
MTNFSAPETIKFCSNCSAVMETRLVGDKPRRACSNCDFIHFTDPKVGVGVFVVHEGEILLVQRKMRPAIGKWSIPAGFVDQGEDPQETAVREAFEETNLHVKIEELIDVFHNPPGQEGASIFIMYRAKLLHGTLQAGDDAAAAAFFPPEALPDIAFASTRAAIQQLVV